MERERFREREGEMCVRVCVYGMLECDGGLFVSYQFINSDFYFYSRSRERNKRGYKNIEEEGKMGVNEDEK